MMQAYTSLGELLRTYREFKHLSQPAFAEKVGRSAREVGRWESPKTESAHPATDATLDAIAEETGISFHVLALLNAGLPVLYDLRTRRYAASESDNAPQSSFRKHDPHELYKLHVRKHRPIAQPHDAELIHGFDMGIYPSERPISNRMYLESGRLIPEMNVILSDRRGHYCGHFVGIPLRRGIHAQMREGKIGEGDLRVDDTCPINDPDGGVLYVCSVFAEHPVIGSWLYGNFLDVLLGWQQQYPVNNFLITAYTVTSDGDKYCRGLGFTKVFENPEEQAIYKTDVMPRFYEMPLQKFVVRNFLRFKKRPGAEA